MCRRFIQLWRGARKTLPFLDSFCRFSPITV